MGVPKQLHPLFPLLAAQCPTTISLVKLEGGTVGVPKQLHPLFPLLAAQCPTTISLVKFRVQQVRALSYVAWCTVALSVFLRQNI